MALAYDYPLLNIFWTMLWIFVFIAWLMTLFSVIADIFASRDMGGWAKALWLLFVLIFPLLGVLVYLIVRGPKMGERVARDAQAQDAAFRSYVQEAAGSAGPAEQLERLVSLRDSGRISPEEYEAAKAKILV